MVATMYKLNHSRPCRPWRAKQDGCLPKNINTSCWVLGLHVMQLLVSHYIHPKTFFSVIVDWNSSHRRYVSGCDFHSKNWVAFLSSGSYGSYHPHTMECIITIEGSDVVVNVVCNVLDRLGCEARYICSLRYYSISFEFVYFLVGAAKTMLMKRVNEEA